MVGVGVSCGCGCCYLVFGVGVVVLIDGVFNYYGVFWCSGFPAYSGIFLKKKGTILTIN